MVQGELTKTVRYGVESVRGTGVTCTNILDIADAEWDLIPPLIRSDNLTGGTRVVAVYARELMALGHEVLVVTCAPDRPPMRRRLGRWLRGEAPPPAPVPGHIALSGVPHRVMDRPGPITAMPIRSLAPKADAGTK